MLCGCEYMGGCRCVCVRMRACMHVCMCVYVCAHTCTLYVSAWMYALVVGDIKICLSVLVTNNLS